MSPDKLFDYLDGTLPANQRAELEKMLLSDPQLQRELEIARRIHRQSRDSREVFADLDEISQPSRGAVLGRRIAILFAALVFLNVLFGLYAIAFLEKKRHAQPNERNRRQLAQALEKSAATAMPAPSLDIGEIKISAAPGQTDAIISKIVSDAAQCGGSATKNLSNENGTLVFAEVPAAREKEFRDKLTELGAPHSEPDASVQGQNRILQIRVVERKS